MLSNLKAQGLLLASGNQGKLKELTRLLEPLQIKALSLRDLDQPFDVAETEPDFAGNAALKARAGYQLSGRPTLADDSGLCVDALQGQPGVYSARYGGPDLDDAGRCRLLLQNLKDVPMQERGAHFACVLAFCYGPGKADLQFFEGRCEGQIALTPAGSGGFGYDPVFLDTSSGRSFATLSPAEKNERSHRGSALAQFIQYLSKL